MKNKFSVTRMLKSGYDVFYMKIEKSSKKSSNHPGDKRMARKLKNKTRKMLDKIFTGEE